MSTLPTAQATPYVSTLHPACPHCGSAGRLLAASVPDFVVGVAGEWDLFSCRQANCGLTFVYPQPTEEQLRGYYSSYITHETPVFDPQTSTGRQGLKGLLKRSRAHQRRELLFLDKMQPGKVLEIGCGNGTNLITLQRQGWDVMGQEIDPPAVVQARRLGIEVHDGDLATLPADRTFDAVILVHVIEHLLEPLDILRNARARLVPGGRLVLVTPNPKSLGFRLFGRFWLPLAQPFHVRLYKLSTLQAIAEKAGFRCIASQTNSTHAASNIRGSIQAVIRRNPGSLLNNKLLAKAVEVFLLFLLLIGDRVSQSIGDECVLICER